MLQAGGFRFAGAFFRILWTFNQPCGQLPADHVHRRQALDDILVVPGTDDRTMAFDPQGGA